MQPDCRSHARYTYAHAGWWVDMDGSERGFLLISLLPISLHGGEFGDKVLEHAAHVLAALGSGEHRVDFGEQGRWGEVECQGRQ